MAPSRQVSLVECRQGWDCLPGGRRRNRHQETVKIIAQEKGPQCLESQTEDRTREAGTTSHLFSGLGEWWVPKGRAGEQRGVGPDTAFRLSRSPAGLSPFHLVYTFEKPKVRKAEDGVWGNLGRLAMTASKPGYGTLVSVLPWEVYLGNKEPFACDQGRVREGQGLEMDVVSFLLPEKPRMLLSPLGEPQAEQTLASPSALTGLLGYSQVGGSAQRIRDER